MLTDKFIVPVAVGWRFKNLVAGGNVSLQLENDSTAVTVFKLPTSPSAVIAVPGAGFDFEFFTDSISGESKEVKVYGFPSTIAAKKHGLFSIVDINPGGADAPYFQISTDSDGIAFANEAADTDIILNFIGTTNSGVLTWMEDEDYFQFADSIKLDGFLQLTQKAGTAVDGDLWNDSRGGR